MLLTLSRWYRDSEMVVWFTSGQSLTACLKPILLFAAPFWILLPAWWYMLRREARRTAGLAATARCGAGH